MNSEQLSERYAQAFISLSEEKNKMYEAQKDIELLSDYFSEASQLLFFCVSPLKKAKEKEDELKKTFTGKVSEITVNFLQLIAQKGRGEFIKEIILKTKQKFMELLGIKKVTLSYAGDFDEEQEKELCSKLEKELGAKQIILHKYKDDSLIGGFKLEFDGKKIDNSIKGKLKKIEQKLNA